MAKEQIFNPNKRGLAKLTDAAMHWLGRGATKALAENSDGTLRDQVDRALSPTTPDQFQANADAKAQAFMKQNGMSEKAVVGDMPLVATTTQELENLYQAPAAAQRNNQGPEQGK